MLVIQIHFWVQKFSIDICIIKQVYSNKYLYEWRTVKDAISLLVTMKIKVQKMRKVKVRARLNIQWRLVNVTRPDKWSQNNNLIGLYPWKTFNFQLYEIGPWDIPEVSLCKYLVRNLFLAGPPFSLPELCRRADLVKFRGLSQSESDSAERGRSNKSPTVVVMWGEVITKLVGSSSS